MIKMYKITFTRYIRRQGSDGNLYVTIPITEERKNNIDDGDLVEVSVKKVVLNESNTNAKATEESV